MIRPGTGDPGSGPGTRDPGSGPGTRDPGSGPGTRDAGTGPGTRDPGSGPGTRDAGTGGAGTGTGAGAGGGARAGAAAATGTRAGGGAGQRILAVDDERQILRALRLILRSAGYEVQTAGSIEDALDRLALSPVDAAIIDLLLPDGDGIELCSRIREWSKMPIIVLSAVGEEEQKVRALRAGADDYVTKPFGPEELVARLEAVLRRVAPEPTGGVIGAAGLEVDLVAHTVRRDGAEIHLTPTEFSLLAALVRNRGRLITHRALLTDVWGPEYADDVTVLRGQIANLRRKIEPVAGPRRHYVRTEPGIGYRFDPR